MQRLFHQPFDRIAPRKVYFETLVGPETNNFRVGWALACGPFERLLISRLPQVLRGNYSNYTTRQL